MKSGKNNPKVTVVCITYNQEKYIGQALDSFLMQKTNFPFEIVVHDDKSTDGTIKILESYQKKYPDIVSLVVEKENQFGKKSVDFIRQMYSNARGEYVAVCEGDDFWTDENKLQKQVDFLDRKKDYAVCFHPVRVFYEDGAAQDSIFPEETSGFTAQKLVEGNYIQTNSVMYRKQQKYEVLTEYLMPLDWYYHLYHAQFGKIGFINKVMSAYRRHDAGIWWNDSANRTQSLNRYGEAQLIFYRKVLELKLPGVDNFDPIIEKAKGLMVEISSNDKVLNRLDVIAKFPEFVVPLMEAIKSRDNISAYLRWKLEYAKILLDYETRDHHIGIKEAVKNLMKLAERKKEDRQRNDNVSSISNKKRPVTIVIPVYDDWPSLKLCIQSVKKFFDTSGGNRVILMNDIGPNADEIEKNILEAIKDLDGFIYHRNPKNLGFIGNCNSAVNEVDETENEILLLNSDAELTEGTVEEMQKVLCSSKSIATVTPRSNNATVFSVPFEPGKEGFVPPIDSYNLYQKVKDTLPEYYETPTAHGFCMLIRREVIRRYGLFDSVYGRGYCEENDFCMRVRHKGFTHAVANKAYAVHEGSKSFTSAGRDEQIAKNHKILTERYPEYDHLIARYVYDVALEEQTLFFHL